MQRWQAEWRRLEDRIAGLQTTVSMIRDMAQLEGHGLAHDAMWHRLRPTIIDVHHGLKGFHQAFAAMLPPLADKHLALALAEIERTGGLGNPHGPSVLPSWQTVVSVAPLIVGLRAEVSARLVDPEADGRRRTERAFEHLCRSIVVDDGYRGRWQRNFGRKATASSGARPANETECERLGAVHLLLHGIWAFKIDAAGERTDLVLQDTLAITRTVEAADALVLTEWKVAATPAAVEAKAHEARQQARLYRRGSLAATELASVRYVVVVTERRERVPEDVTEDGVTYRFVNVAVAPESASKPARRKRAS
jgi:hypothetical protein